MHGRKCLALSVLVLALAGCSGNPLMKPDCHSCTVEEQEWKEFSWASLVGRWKGSVENLRNDRSAVKKAKTEKAAELVFLRGDQFQQAHGNACASLPANALVLNGMLWEQSANSKTKEFEAFVPADDNKVAYGRVSFEKVNGKELCHFQRLGRIMGKNRLNLPSVSFSDHGYSASGRAPASVAGEQDVNVEFLRFALADKPMKAFQADGRRPSSVKEQERPSLILRVFKVGSKPGGDRGEWSGTEEYIYRMWKAE